MRYIDEIQQRIMYVEYLEEQCNKDSSYKDIDTSKLGINVSVINNVDSVMAVVTNEKIEINKEVYKIKRRASKLIFNEKQLNKINSLEYIK